MNEELTDDDINLLEECENNIKERILQVIIDHDDIWTEVLPEDAVRCAALRALYEIWDTRWDW